MRVWFEEFIWDDWRGDAIDRLNARVQARHINDYEVVGYTVDRYNESRILLKIRETNSSEESTKKGKDI